LEVLHWLVIQPCKAYALTYCKHIESHTAALIEARHIPACFDDYVGIINEHGLIFPVSEILLETMPFAFRLLTLNTFSESRMTLYLGKKAKKFLEAVKKKSKDILYYDTIKTSNGAPFSNVGMVVLMVLRLIRGSLLEPKDKGYQGIV
jgi:hypothetical protein